MKARGDSKLKVLPPARQAELFDHIEAHTLHQTKAWLAEDGLNTSIAAISEFREWYQIRRDYSRMEEDALTLAGVLKNQMPELAPEKLQAYGEALFNIMAVKKLDPKLYLDMQTAKHNAEMDHKKFDQRERELQLQKDKFEFNAARACLTHLPSLRTIAADTSLDQNAKLQAIRAKLFGQLPEESK